MADNTLRAYRYSDGPEQRAGRASDPREALQRLEDPLAELARLIGTIDPYAAPQQAAAAPGQDEFPREPEHYSGYDAPAPRRHDEWSDAARPDGEAYSGQGRLAAGADVDHAYDRHADAQEAYRREPAASAAPEDRFVPQMPVMPAARPRRDDYGYDPAALHFAADEDAGWDQQPSPRDLDQQRGFGHAQHVQHAPQQAVPAYRMESYEADPAPPQDAGHRQPSDSHGYEAQLHDERGFGAPPVADDGYDDMPRPRRRGTMLTVAAVLCLAVVGTATAFAVRSFVGTSRSDQPPPVIKANSEPLKVVPAQTETAANKLIQDRAGNGQDERLVSREEKPVDLKTIRPPQSAAIFPPVGDVGVTGATGTAGSSTALTEPRRIRTVTIRPDMPSGQAAPQGEPSAPANARTQAGRPAQNPAVQHQAAQPVPAPASQPMSLAAASVAAQQASPAHGQQGSAPISLAPPQARTQTASAAPQAAMPAAPQAATTGGYLVQVASQRSEGDAMASFRSLQSRYPMMASQGATIRRADLGERGVFYRAMVGPFASSEQANQFCGQLKAAGGQCLIQRN